MSLTTGNGFLLIDSCVSLALLSLLISFFIFWHSRTLWFYQCSQAKIETLLHARTVIEKIKSGQENFPDDRYNTAIHSYQDGDFSWITVTVSLKNKLDILPVILTSGYLRNGCS